MASVFFVLLWRCELATLRRLATKIEDAAVYLGPDPSEAVRGVLCMAMIALKNREASLFKKCIKLMRRSVADMVDQHERDYGQSLLDKLASIDFAQLNHFASKTEDGRPHGRGADFKILQICPLLPKDIEVYLDHVAGEVAQEEMMMSARYTNVFSSQVADEDDDDSPERDDSQSKNDRINSYYKKDAQEKFKRYRNQSNKAPTITEYTEESLNSKANGRRSSAKKSSRTQKKGWTATNTGKEESKLKSADDYPYIHRVTDFRVSSPLENTDRDNQHRSEPSKVPACLVSPKEQSLIRVDYAPQVKVTRFDDQQDNYQLEKRRHLDQVFGSALDVNQDNQDILNEEIKLILDGKGKIIPSKREHPNDQLYNESVIKIIEDIIMGGEKDDIIKLHAYFSGVFHKEPSRMTILDNILDMCMYYLAVEHGPFRPHTKIVLQVVSEYLRGTSGL